MPRGKRNKTGFIRGKFLFHFDQARKPPFYYTLIWTQIGISLEKKIERVGNRTRIFMRIPRSGHS